MKKRYKILTGKGLVEKEYNHIPIRYLIAVGIAVLEILAIIGVVLALCYYLPWFYFLSLAVNAYCVVKIISSDDNPDYKIPWLLCVIILPIAGFMLYFMFYSRKLKPKFLHRVGELSAYKYHYDDSAIFDKLKREDRVAYSQAKMLTKISDARIFTNTSNTYFPSGAEMLPSLLRDLEAAEQFILLEFFIIDEGIFWESVIDILKRKASQGIDVRVMYDDIGCMSTLPGNYDKILQKHGIKSVIFSKLRGSADSEFNNRDHRKIIVIDGKVAYTGGVNIADEYIGERIRFGEWKDSAIRIEGVAAKEFTRMTLSLFGINSRRLPPLPTLAYPENLVYDDEGYIIPFGDGPRPLYKQGVAKSAIQNMIGAAIDYVYITTPYLIIDNDLCSDIERAALRGVDVRIVVPHIPDKRIVFGMTRSFYRRLIYAGVKIYEYEPGFIHSKTYVADGKYAIVGTVNLDYRSLVHHFEDGVWMYKTSSISDVKDDIDSVIKKSILITDKMLKAGVLRRIFRSLVRIFAPML